MVCEIGGIAAILWSATSWICSKQHAAFLCSCHQAFSPNVSLESRWGNPTVVLIQLQLGKIPVLFYQKSDFHMIDNLLIAVDAFPINMLTSLSVNDILLLRYVNWCINFRGLSFNVEMAHIIYFIWIWIKANASCCFRLCRRDLTLSRCICKKQ